MDAYDVIVNQPVVIDNVRMMNLNESCVTCFLI